MSQAMQPHEAAFVSAPAGSGKTVQLVRRYLWELRKGRDPSQIIAITFTRKAAAELVERIGRVLQGAVDGKAVVPEDAELYDDLLPDRAVATAALAALPNAPVSTVDAFVFALVSEHLLDARYDLGDSTAAWLDGPLQPAGNAAEVFVDAARKVLDEAVEHDAAVGWLLDVWTLGEACAAVAALARWQSVDSLGWDGAALWQAMDEALLQADAAGDVEEKALRNKLADADRPTDERMRDVFSMGPDTLAGVEARALLADARLDPALTEDDTFSSLFGKKASSWDSMSLGRADALRATLRNLAQRVRRDALRRLAARGEADHSELLRVAIDLCRRAKDAPAGTALARLRERYGALLVDEVQDTNPDQLAFYQAIVAMRPEISRFYVGDVRQSIYRFRGADPGGWQRMVREAAEHERATLDVNYRSVTALVDFQRTMVRMLTNGPSTGLEPLDGVISRDEKGGTVVLGQRLELVDANAVAKAPVLIVSDPGAKSRSLGSARSSVLRALAVRLQSAPAKQTAAVLMRGWARGSTTVAELAALGVQARVVGDRTLLQSRPAVDLRLLVDVLLDPTDDLAWVGVLKHPCVGVRDGSLAALRPFGRLLAPRVAADDATGTGSYDGLDPADAARLDVVLPLLREGRLRIGREPTAELLDELVTRLGWRPMLLVGPDGRAGVAQLDLLLELVRAVEGAGVDPFAVQLALRPGEEDADSLPKLRLDDEGRVVDVTTVHSAKGLEWDHVAILDDLLDPVGGNKLDAPAWRLDLGDGDVLALRFDPRGGLEPKDDVVTLLGKGVAKQQEAQERERLLYVAVTRAKRTLTMVPCKAKDGWTDPTGELQDCAAVHWIDVDAEGPDGPLLPPIPAELPLRAPSRVGRVEPVWLPSEGAAIRSPSRLAEGQRDGGALKARYLARARVAAGTGAAPSLPVSLADKPERVVGDLVHGWLEAWAFDGAFDDPVPDDAALIERARDWLVRKWHAAGGDVAPWLVAVGRHLVRALPESTALLREDGTTPRFEVPLLAQVPSAAEDAPDAADLAEGVLAARTREHDVLVGRADLVLEHADGSVTLLDFKAGTHGAAAGKDGAVAEIPGLGQYAWQLEAYGRAFEGAGRRVRAVGLVYVRATSLVLWDWPVVAGEGA